MKLVIGIAALCVLAAPATQAANLNAPVRGLRICFAPAGIAEFQADGTYFYTGAVRRHQGTWQSLGGNRVKEAFPDGPSRIDTYVVTGNEVQQDGPKGPHVGHVCN